MVSDDWYVELFEQVESTGAELRQALDHIVGILSIARQERIDGVPFVHIAERLVERGVRDLRRSNEEAFRTFSAAVAACRSAGVRALVDEEGMTHAEVARLLGVSRQMVGRLYQNAPPRRNDSVSLDGG